MRESRLLHMLSHIPFSANGTTGTGRLARMRSTPDLKGAISPSRVNAPSGKMQTSSPAANAASTSWKACSISCGSSRVPAIGIARAALKIQPAPGVLNIL